ncbi:MAG: hypothetical protein ACRD0D_02250, partial [Acidimicrobiales bacterium]
MSTIGDQALSYAEVKALATGNPLILEKASVDADVAKLGRLRRSHLDDQHRLRRALDAAERRATSAGGRIRRLEKAIDVRTDTRGDRFTMTVGGVRHRKRPEAGDNLHRLVAGLAGRGPGRADAKPVGELAGLELQAGLDSRFAEFSLTVPGADIEVRCPTDEWGGVDPVSLVQRLERRIQHLDATLAEVRTEHAGATQEAEKARIRIGTPLEHPSRGVQL